jgi:hypothetical protein
VKRRYKPGDWLRVPLGGEYDAIGIIARMCRSRLFGYFFAVPASYEPSHDDLRARRAQDALAALLFGGAAIEEARWDLIATSLAFDPQAWPFPAFASRGAFGDAWTQVRYDPQTLQIAERRAIDDTAAATLPDARFAGAEDAERILRARIAGESSPPAQSIIEVRSPLEPQRLHALERGGRIQFSTLLSCVDLDRLAAFIEGHSNVGLRVHGFRHGFDAAQLSRLGALRELTLDVHDLQHPDALRDLRHLRILRIGHARLHLGFLDALTGLQTLELRRTRAALDPVKRLPSLHALVLESTAPVDLRALRSATVLQTLVLAHGDYDVNTIDALAQLRRLELRALDVRTLPALRVLAHLEDLHVHALGRLTDLQSVADAPALRRLRITAMPHLNVPDFAPLQRCAGLHVFHVEVGSRSKEREIYRLIKAGNT